MRYTRHSIDKPYACQWKMRIDRFLPTLGTKFEIGHSPKWLMEKEKFIRRRNFSWSEKDGNHFCSSSWSFMTCRPSSTNRHADVCSSFWKFIWEKHTRHCRKNNLLYLWVNYSILRRKRKMRRVVMPFFPVEVSYFCSNHRTHFKVEIPRPSINRKAVAIGIWYLSISLHDVKKRCKYLVPWYYKWW